MVYRIPYKDRLMCHYDNNEVCLLVSVFQSAEVEQRRMQSCIHFMNLKKLNRLAHMRLKRGRDQTHDVSPT